MNKCVVTYKKIINLSKSNYFKQEERKRKYVLFSMIVLNSRDRYENVWLPDFHTSKNHFVTEKIIGTAVITLYLR